MEPTGRPIQARPPPSPKTLSAVTFPVSVVTPAGVARCACALHSRVASYAFERGKLIDCTQPKRGVAMAVSPQKILQGLNRARLVRRLKRHFLFMRRRCVSNL